jgi:FtsZ-binding cell division protein ZapB
MLSKPEKEPTETERAKAQIQSLAARENELIEEKRTLGVALEQLELEAGDRFLEGGHPEKNVAQVLQVKSQIEAVGRAIKTCRQRRMEAVGTAYQTEAEELKKRAQTLRDEAQRIKQATEPLLRKLSEIEGVEFTRAILLSQRDANWLPHPIYGKPVDECGPEEAQRNSPYGGYLTPKSAALEAEAARIEQIAASVELTKIRVSGSITVDSLQAVLDAIALRTDQLLPAQDSLEAWFATIEAKIAKERPELGGHMRRSTIVWQDGELDESISRAQILKSSAVGGDVTFSTGA